MRRSKYAAVRTTIDNITFASKREAHRYQELKLLEKAGWIRNLRLQPRYLLCALVINGADIRDVNVGEIAKRRCPIGNYVADFEYEQSEVHGKRGAVWVLKVEDAKGVKTPVYKLKKRIFEAQYGISITEV